MKKRTIPDAYSAQIPFNVAVKENLEQIMGQRGGKVKPLPTTATLDDVIAKVNELVERLQ